MFAAAAVVLFVIAYSAASVVFQLGALLVAALLVAAIVVVRVHRPRLAAVRTFQPPLVSAGGTLRVVLDVRNRASSRSSAATWLDRLPFAPGATADAPLPALAPAGARYAGRGNATTVSYTVRPPRRGVLELGPFEVHTVDPFGLVRGTAVVAGTQTIVVTPGLVDLMDAGLGLSAGDGTARLIQRAMLGNDDDLMTREYRRGDAMRRVHWRVSARQGELMVRQEEQRSKPEVRLVVDTRRSGYSDAATGYVPVTEVESETFEWVVRMVASIGVHLRQAGYSVTVLESAPGQIEPFGAFGTPDEPFLASLATIRLSDSHATPRSAPEAIGTAFAVLADPDPEALAWVISLRRPRERAIAFLPVWATRARDALFAAGWQVVLFRPSDELSAVWAAVALEDGVV